MTWADFWGSLGFLDGRAGRTLLVQPPAYWRGVRAGQESFSWRDPKSGQEILGG